MAYDAEANISRNEHSRWLSDVKHAIEVVIQDIMENIGHEIVEHLLHNILLMKYSVLWQSLAKDIV